MRLKHIYIYICRLQNHVNKHNLILLEFLSATKQKLNSEIFRAYKLVKLYIFNISYQNTPMCKRITLNQCKLWGQHHCYLVVLLVTENRYLFSNFPLLLEKKLQNLWHYSKYNTNSLYISISIIFIISWQWRYTP